MEENTRIRFRPHEARLQSNKFWLEAIGAYDRLGIPLDKIPDPYDHQRITPAELGAAAQKYLPSDAYMHFTMMPLDSTIYTREDSTTAGSGAKRLSGGTGW